MIYKNFKIGEEDYFLLPMKLEDLSRFKEIRDQCLEFIHDNKSYTYQETIKWFLSNDIRYLSLYTNDKMIGYVRLKTNSNQCHIGMDLDPEFWGKHIAFTTYNLVMLELQKYGISEFKLRVLQNNDKAVRLYKHLNFAMINSREGVTVREGKSIGDFEMIHLGKYLKRPIEDNIKPGLTGIIEHLQTKNDKGS